MRYYVLFMMAFSFAFSNAQNYQFLGTYSSNGTPDYLIDPADVVSAKTQQLISDVLPEGYPVPEYNPHYISSGYDTDIILVDSADIWVTFVKEGAGYKNVLGFYTYDVNNPSNTAPEAKDITIIFPNVSAEGSGGGLNVGDKVKIGSFAEGTAIGWVLLANGWKDGQVTPGNWQLFSNPLYNPEADVSLTYHNVLLKDSENELVILGFEDIRRDYSSCDNDFNDAVFYVTANPYTAIKTDNINDVESASDVSSANSGGLESNGALAGLIAQRNFSRNVQKTHKVLKSQQTQLAHYSNFLKSTAVSNLSTYIPQSGMFGNEEAFVSSPKDLVGITNAEDVFSVDYYKDNNRVAAVLASYSLNKVYDHSKAICDRLNSSSLEDVRTVNVRGHQLIRSKIRRANGTLENTLSFSIKELDNQYQLYSYWNIDQYPEGDYYNFQIWGSSFSQVFALANKILDRFNNDKNLIKQVEEKQLPGVIVKSGYYAQGMVHLQLLNKSNYKQIEVNGSMSVSENSEREDFYHTVELSGQRHDSVSLETGSLFDIGLSISADNTFQYDALYLADGPWGTDFIDEMASLESFKVNNHLLTHQDSVSYHVERNPSITGRIKGTFNVFRQLLPGEQYLDIESYENVLFKMKNTHPIEIILMEEGMQNWEDRYRFFIEANSEETNYSISLSNFKNKQGKSFSKKTLSRIVFSANGNGISFVPFEMELTDLVFSKSEEVTSAQTIFNEESRVNIYPNPFQNQITIDLNETSSYLLVRLVDASGRLVDTQKIMAHNVNQFVYSNINISKGIYYLTLINDKNEVLSTQLLMKN